ncbi:MAG: substrate-binding domain-containing protein [Tepidisphaeraceae bacterium]
MGIAVEGVTTYGRSILRGVLKYANLQRKWVLHKDIWRTTGDAVHWPDCDGTIIAGVPEAIYNDVRAHSRFVVTCSGSYDSREVPVIALDEDATATMAAEHLLSRCLEHFAFYGPSWDADTATGGRPRLTMIRRARGFHLALKRHGRRCINANLPVPTLRELFTHAHHPKTIAWLRSLPKPIGIFAADDMLAHDLAEACREADIGVPEDVAIIGVNNDDLLCESAWPPLSSVEVDFSRMGYLAAKTLDRLLSGEKLRKAERLIELPPIRVQQRMSTDVLATTQRDLADAVRFIREHACDPCSVSDVLKAVPFARRSLERQFVEQLGRSPHAEISRVRIETARRLLMQPDLSVNDVCERCGFAAIQSFNRFFLQSVGITPAAFRRQGIHGVSKNRQKTGRK